MIAPHGGKLVKRVAVGRRRERIVDEVKELTKIRVGYGEALDAENICTGLYSPLEGFMTREEVESTLKSSRLPNDLPWGLPVVIQANVEVKEGDDVALVMEDLPIAVLTVEETYKLDRHEMVTSVFGTDDVNHPGVRMMLSKPESFIAGSIELINRVPMEYGDYALTPLETRVLFKEKGWKRVAGFQSRNVPHMGHEATIRLALEMVDGVYINPVLGLKKIGDYPDDLIAGSYRILVENYLPKGRVAVGFLKYAMRYAGPREALHHAIMRKNLGCTHFIVGRDHAGVGSYYAPYEAQDFLENFPDLGIELIPVKEYRYCKKCGYVVSEKTCSHDGVERISGTKIRAMLEEGKKPPATWMREEVVDYIMGKIVSFQA